MADHIFPSTERSIRKPVSLLDRSAHDNWMPLAKAVRAERLPGAAGSEPTTVAEAMAKVPPPVTRSRVVPAPLVAVKSPVCVIAPPPLSIDQVKLGWLTS